MCLLFLNNFRSSISKILFLYINIIYLSLGNQCRDPCKDNSPCGDCATCEVLNHEVQCSCPAGGTGDPFASCFSNSLKCGAGSTSISKTRNRFSSFFKRNKNTGGCKTGELCTNGFCVKNCQGSNDCDCGETCVGGTCLRNCLSAKDCNNGLNCIQGVCTNGCLLDQDCDSSTACINGQCSDPCKGTVDCGNHAVCQTAAHRPVCLCPKGYQRSSTGQGKLKLDKLKLGKLKLDT